MRFVKRNLSRLLLAAAISGHGVALGETQSWKKFDPAEDRDARDLLGNDFRLTQDLKAVDPSLRLAFRKRIEGAIANRNEQFAAGDALLLGNNLPTRRFVLAGVSPHVAFIWYEQGGIALRHEVVIFRRAGEGWTATGTITGHAPDKNFDSMKKAVKEGMFLRESGPAS